MEAKLIVAVIFVCAVCYGTKADVPKPTLLQTNITSCGSSILCWSSPSSCNPSINSSCLFSSFQLNNQTASIELSGWNSGYIALGLSGTNQSQAGDVVFVCGNNNTTLTNGTFFFDTATQNNSWWTSTNVSSIYTVQGAVNQNQSQSLIQCAFNFTANLLINSTSNLTLNNATTIYFTFMSGSTNGTTLGNATTTSKFSVQLNSTNSNMNSPSSSTVSTGSALNITRDGCGTSKLCVSTSSTCNLTGNSSCFFASSKLSNQAFIFELSGTTSGYVALGLTKQNSTYVFVCGNNNTGGFFFQTATQNGTALTSANVTTVYSVQGAITQNQSVIQCTFNTSTTFNISTRAADNSYSVSIFTGSTNGTQLGNLTQMFESSTALDLSNATSQLTTQNATTTTSSPNVSTGSALNITRDGCGTSKLCVSTSSTCNLTGNSSCFFASSKLSNQAFIFELSGTTSGYVALGLTKQNSTYVFVCGNNNTGGFFFQTATQNGTALTSANVTTVYSVQGAITQNQSVIQCTFNTSTTFNISTRAADNSYSVSIFTGSTNGTQLGNLTQMFESSTALDLSNATSQLTTQNATTTTSSPNVSTGSALNITRDGCGTSKLCVSNSSTCNLTGNSSCFFASSKLSNQAFIFELSGTTSGYVALGLTKQNSTYVFVCGNNNTGGFFFQTATQNGTALTSANVTTVYSVQGAVTQNQSVIQCTFNASTEAADNSYFVSIFTGSTNGTQLGNPTQMFQSSSALNLSNPTSQPTTTTPTTPSGGNSLASLWTHVLAVLLSAMSLHFITSHSP
ncbi:hypothetical protein QTP70_026525 [Hemibagrus guttatus]|uniref:DOMON domain-containing protein n=1 Tax=Hemibagrus guttatus TaxID=175788 RepID=A0AAE0R996_9TELE|nr:hypothetical protein QTP70_026525 [Hemibagrus guttatus]